MLKKLLLTPQLALLLLISSFHSFAEQEATKELPCSSSKNTLAHEVKKATPIKKISPKYPVNAARKKLEGWVRLSFVIKADGSVDLPVIEDSSGIESFEEAATEAVKQWKYNPAIRDEQNIEQCQNSVQLNFKMNKPTKGASRKFVREFKSIHQLLDDKQLADALVAINSLENKPRQNFYEDKFFFSLKAKYYQYTGDNRQELRNLRKIIPQGKDYLPKGSYTYSLVRAFELALLNNELSSALYFYNQLKQFNPEFENIDILVSYVEKINTLISSSDNIYVGGQINERENWNHYLARSRFTVSKIEGELNSLDIRCDNHFSTYSLEVEKQWNIPESWGKCKVFVHGKQGATFDLIEVANKAA